MMQYLSHFIVIGFLSRTLLDFRIIWNPARVWNRNAVCLAYAANVSCFDGCLMSINIFFGS